ncbi:MAG TPA: copper transporter [Gaiellaceae bacterium]|nr:copper transporter [Gaiellaceae bacterium]
MFDLRYHVASLTAVFLALVIGILVGVGVSGRGFVTDAERTNFNNRLAALDAQLEEEQLRGDELERRQDAAQEFVESAYPVLADGRLDDVDVAVLVIGSYDATVDAVQRAIEDAGGDVSRIRAVTVPMPMDEVQGALRSRSAFGGYVGEDEVDNLGRDLGHELVDGGDTPLWDLLTADLVGQREGSSLSEADGVVVVRQAEPQQRETARFLAGLYRGLANAGVPAVGVEGTRPDESPIPAFSRAGLSTVDGVDTPLGRLALILLLAGSERGDFGVAETATDGILPTLEPLPAVTTSG